VGVDVVEHPLDRALSGVAATRFEPDRRWDDVPVLGEP
jgi:hypothetical protein